MPRHPRETEDAMSGKRNDNDIASLTITDLRRINVVGVSGSGKSWISERLGAILNVTVTEMDMLQWGPNWTPAETATLRNRVTEIVGQERWILDGNYHEKTHDIKWPRTTLIVWVDMPFVKTIRRVLQRAVRRSWTGREIWPETGNRETFRGTFFSRDSVVLWSMRSFRPIRKRYEEISVSPDRPCRVIRLGSDSTVRQFLTHAAQLHSGPTAPSSSFGDHHE